MNLNPFNFLYKIQDATLDIAESVSELMPTEQISLWQLIWGYDSISGEYSLTSLIVMSLLFPYVYADKLLVQWNLN